MDEVEELKVKLAEIVAQRMGGESHFSIEAPEGAHLVIGTHHYHLNAGDILTCNGWYTNSIERW